MSMLEKWQRGDISGHNLAGYTGAGLLAYLGKKGYDRWKAHRAEKQFNQDPMNAVPQAPEVARIEGQSAYEQTPGRLAMPQQDYSGLGALEDEYQRQRNEDVRQYTLTPSTSSGDRTNFDYAVGQGVDKALDVGKAIMDDTKQRGSDIFGAVKGWWNSGAPLVSNAGPLQRPSPGADIEREVQGPGAGPHQMDMVNDANYDPNFGEGNAYMQGRYSPEIGYGGGLMGQLASQDPVWYPTSWNIPGQVPTYTNPPIKVANDSEPQHIPMIGFNEAMQNPVVGNSQGVETGYGFNSSGNRDYDDMRRYAQGRARLALATAQYPDMWRNVNNLPDAGFLGGRIPGAYGPPSLERANTLERRIAQSNKWR